MVQLTLGEVAIIVYDGTIRDVHDNGAEDEAKDMDVAMDRVETDSLDEILGADSDEAEVKGVQTNRPLEM